MATIEESTLYDGKFFTVTPTRLIIKLYYFPYGSKTIELAKLRSIHTAQELDLHVMNMKKWGLGLEKNRIWFANGFGAPYMTRLVIEVEDDSRRRGFSYEDDDGGLEILKRAWQEAKTKLAKENEGKDNAV